MSDVKIPADCQRTKLARMLPPDPGASLLSAESDRREQLRLRFSSTVLEAQFRRDHEIGSRTSRLVLLGLGAIMIAVTPLYDRPLLDPPEAFVSFSRWMQFAVQIPAVLAVFFITWHRGLRHFSAPAIVLGAAAVAGGLCAQHVVGARLGFSVPHDFAALAVAAIFMLGQLRVFYFLPAAVALMIATTLAQLQAGTFSSAAIYDAISTWMLFALALAGAYLLEVSARTAWRQRVILESEAARDALTDLPNRRHFDSMLVRLVRQAARERKSVALMILDVDDFKAYNDTYGHPAGDQCLRRVSRWLREAMRRPQDFCARIGGEEFAAVWFDAQPSAAPVLAEELRAGIRQLAITHAGSSTGRTVSASAGFAQVFSPRSEDAAASIALELIARADQALYEAKRGGRDRLVDTRFPASPAAAA